MAIVKETYDADHSNTTFYSIGAGDIFEGVISSSADKDLIAVQLTAGREYVFSMDASGATNDESLFLYSTPTGGVLDQSGNGQNWVAYVPKVSGEYYLSASFSNRTVGGYEVSITQDRAANVGTPGEFADFLLNGYWAYHGDPNPVWLAALERPLVIDASALNPKSQELVRHAAQAWAEVSNLDFEYGTRNADITFETSQNGYFALFDYTRSLVTGATINLDASSQKFPGDVGGWLYAIILHELGHAIGLGHSGPYNFSAEFGIDTLFSNDTELMTVMSYFAPDQDYFSEVSVGAGILIPMTADIVAIQRLYGFTSVSPTDTRYGTNGDTGTMAEYFLALKANEPQSRFAVSNENHVLTLHDTGGTDTIDLSASLHAMELSLVPGTYTDFMNGKDVVRITETTWIENLIAGNSADMVTGNAIGNNISALGGDDTVMSGNGDDTVAGGVGHDVLSGERGSDLLKGGDGEDWLFGGAGEDTLYGDAGFDNLYGGVDNDTLYGGDNHDTLVGELGNDVLSGDAGNDALYGNAFEDWLFGGQGNDTLYGDAGFDNLFGGLGDDFAYGGDQEDTLSGEQGNDVLSGENGFDMLRGGDDDDWLFGGGDGDTLYGDIGDDNLFGGLGNDFLFGGAGADVLNAEQGFDVLSGEGGDDMLNGGADNDWMFGGDGNDTLNGDADDDHLFGSFGRDVLNGGAGNDTIDGEQGTDLFIFADGHGMDVVHGFEATNDAENIDLSGVSAITDFTDLRDNHMAQAGENVVITTGTGSITLTATKLGDLLDGNDFLF